MNNVNTHGSFPSLQLDNQARGSSESLEVSARNRRKEPYRLASYQLLALVLRPYSWSVELFGSKTGMASLKPLYNFFNYRKCTLSLSKVHTRLSSYPGWTNVSL